MTSALRNALSLRKMTPIPTILTAQTALLAHCNTTQSHTPLTLHHKHGFINAVETTDPGAPSSTTLFLLHGWGAGLGMYYRALPKLPYKTVYTIDLPGMGGSSRERLPRDYDQALAYFLDALDEAFQQIASRGACTSQKVLAGHSLGGFLATEWQLRRARFNGLVLISPVGIPQKPVSNARLGMAWRLVRALWGSGVTPQAFVRAFGRAPVRTFVRGRFALPNEDNDLVTEYMYAISAAPPGAERSMNVLLEPGAWARVPLQGRLSGLDVPVGFLYGEQDWMDWTAGELAQKELRWSRLERVKGAGHHVFVDNPEEFARVFENVVGLMEGEMAS